MTRREAITNLISKRLFTVLIIAKIEAGLRSLREYNRGMKDRWCGNFEVGKCKAASEGNKPRLAEDKRLWLRQNVLR